MAGLFAARRRDLAADARALTARLRPPLGVRGTPPDLQRGGWLLLLNHYHRPGFRAWWLALALSAVVPRPVHWLVTSEWRSPDGPRRWFLSPLSRWTLARLRRMYGFTLMPPMPPQPQDFPARTASALELLRRVRSQPQMLVGLAPEGADNPAGGRLVGALVALGLQPLPIGVYEQEGRLWLHFGQPLPPAALAPTNRAADRLISTTVMRAIAACLPPHLQGPYRQEQI